MHKIAATLFISAASSTSFLAVAQDEPAAYPAGAAPAPEATPAAQSVPDRTAAPAWTPVGYPDAYVLRPLTVPFGMFQGTLPVVLNLSQNSVLKPVWIPLDMRFGMTNQFEVFVSHNALGAPLAVGRGGLCLGSKQYCPSAYNNLNVGGQYSFVKGKAFELSGLLVAEFKEFTPDTLFAIDVGVGVKYLAPPFSVKATPRIGVGVYKRRTGNQEAIGVPVQIALQAAPRIAVFVDTGLFGSTSQFSGNYQVPLGIGADFLALHGFDVGAEFMFPALGRGSAVAGKATDSRTLMLYAAWRSP